MAYDALDGYMVLFGGLCEVTCPVGDGQTWIFENSDWKNLTGSLLVAPADRQGASMIYDPADQYIVLFGGYENGTTSLGFADTWTFAHGEWSRLNTSTAPGARFGASFVWDAHDGYGVLFGGEVAQSGGGPWLNDTWKFVHGNWTALSPTMHPAKRNYAGATYDPIDEYVVLFGGQGTLPGPPFYTGLGDTWTFSEGEWSNITASAGAGPEPLIGVEMAYDATDHYVLAYGGLQYSGFVDTTGTYAFVNGSWASPVVTNNAEAQDSSPISSYPPWGSVMVVVYGEGNTYVYPPPLSVAVTASESSPDAGENVSFSSTIANGAGPYTFDWRFGDGTTSAEADPTHVYAAAGKFTVNLTVLDFSNETAASDSVESVFTGLAVTASSNVSDSDVGVPIQFSATTSGGSGSYSTSWSFGDGQTANGTSVKHVYSTARQYTVTAKVGDSVGGTASKAWTVTVNGVPTSASVTVSPVISEVGVPSWFNWSVTGGTAPLNYTWSGLPTGCVTTNTSTLDCTPTSAGNSTVVVTAKDNVGGHASSTSAITVKPKFTVQTNWNSSGLVCGTTIAVELNATESGGVPPYQASWNFGDGSNASSGANAEHAYPANNEFTATVTAEDADHARVVVPVTVTTLESGCSGGTTAPFGGTVGGIPVVLILGGVIAVGAVLVIGVLIRRRGRQIE